MRFLSHFWGHLLFHFDLKYPWFLVLIPTVCCWVLLFRIPLMMKSMSLLFDVLLILVWETDALNKFIWLLFFITTVASLGGNLEKFDDAIFWRGIVAALLLREFILTWRLYNFVYASSSFLWRDIWYNWRSSNVQVWCIVSSLHRWQEETELSFYNLSLSAIVLSISNYSWITFFIHVIWLQRISEILQIIFLSRQLLFIRDIHQWNIIRDFPNGKFIWLLFLWGRRACQFLGVPKSILYFRKIQSLTWFNNK